MSLRNYVYTNFSSKAKEAGLDLIFWNNSPLDLSAMGYESINFPKIKLHWQTDALKNGIKHNELNKFKAETANSIFDAYKFSWNTNGLKNKLKTFLAKHYIKLRPSDGYIVSLRKKLKKQEASTQYFETCKRVLQEVQPDVVFCTSQRPVAGVAPMEAAKKLGIPTVCSIFSWDNLPKATLVVEADHYIVWSEHMKRELDSYYPFTSKSQTHITGTPQFENHYNKEFIMDRDTFFKENDLDSSKRYLCFSGDDVTTSPFDPQYLEDVAQAVVSYNQNANKQLGIIFRRCPVDFSDRYDRVLNKYTGIIIPIAPLWKSVGQQWDKKIPTKEDLILQSNIAEHSELVINVGSSMVFDFAAHNTPCGYLNYNPEGSDIQVKDIHKIYKYIHFQSMPHKDAVIWLNSKESILEELIRVIDYKEFNITKAYDWFEKIVEHPVNKASENIVQVLKSIPLVRD